MNLTELHRDVYELGLGYYALARISGLFPHTEIPLFIHRIDSPHNKYPDCVCHIQTWLDVRDRDVIFYRRLYESIGSLPERFVSSERLAINPRRNPFSYCSRRFEPQFSRFFSQEDYLFELRDVLNGEISTALEWFLFSDVSYKVSSLRRLFWYSLSQVVADISRGRIAAKEAYHIQEANDPLVQPNRLISTSIRPSSCSLTFNWQCLHPTPSQLDDAMCVDTLAIRFPINIDDLEQVYGLHAYRSMSDVRKSEVFRKLCTQFFLDKLPGISLMLELHPRNERIAHYHFVCRKSSFSGAGSIYSNLTSLTLQDLQRSDYTPSVGELFALSYLMNAAS